MKRALLAAAIVLIASVAGITARQDLPEGRGRDEVARLCAGCHDLTFTISTRETEEGWTRIVNDMRSRGVDGSEDEFAQVIAYLTAHMGTNEPSAKVADPRMGTWKLNLSKSTYPPGLAPQSQTLKWEPAQDG